MSVWLIEETFKKYILYGGFILFFFLFFNLFFFFFFSGGRGVCVMLGVGFFLIKFWSNISVNTVIWERVQLN